MSSRIPALATPKLIEWARRKAGLSRDEIARHLKVPPDRVAEWEEGSSNPTVIQLRRFGRLVRRPLAFFYLPEPPHDFDAIRDFRRVAGLEPEPESPELLFAIRSAHDRRSIALDLMEDLGEEPETHLPTARLIDEPEELAISIRNGLGYDFQAANRWSSFYEALNFWRTSVEERGILVQQFGEVSRAEARGFSVQDLPLPVIAVNRTEWPQARIFSMVHEFVHLMLRQGGLCDFIEREGGLPEEREVEVFCNRVAGAVLVPRAELLSHPIIARHRRRTDLEEKQIRDLSQRFRVSREVILRRLLIADQITQRFYDTKREEYDREFEIERASSSTGFAPPHVIALSAAGHRYANLVLRGYRQKRITAADVAEFLGVRLKHLPRIEASLIGAI